MGSVTLYSFEEVDSNLETNQGYYEHCVDFGEVGEHEIFIDTDYIVESECISTSTESVTIDTGILAGELVNQGELEDLLRDLCKETSFDEVFDILVTISPDYNNE